MTFDLDLTNLTPEARAEIDLILQAQRIADARSDLIPFAQAVFPRYQPDPMHYLIGSYLMKVLRREIRRLMVFAPPQHGKSTLTSQVFPAYWLGHRPDEPIILSSYGAELAEFHSGEAKRIIESESYQTIFPQRRTRPDSRAKNRWHVVGHQGGMVATGMEGGIAGKPAGLAIIDDPVKNYEEAISETIRQRNWNWYDIDLYQRLWEDAPIILIMTRWHEDDLAGRILNSPQRHDWTILRLPALAETQEERDENNRRLNLPPGLPDPLNRQPGEAVAPQRYSARYLRELRGDGSSYRWNALYMGVPRPAEGNMVKRAWLPIVDHVPFKAQRIRYWDKASSTKESGGARTAGVLLALAEDGYLYVEDVMMGHWLAHERDQIMRQTAELDAMRTVIRDPDRPDADPRSLPGYGEVRTWAEQEPGSGGKDSADATVRLLFGFSIWIDKVTGSKDARFEPFAAQAGRLRVRVKRADWNQAWIDEICSFPNSQYRDMSDATAGAFNKLHTPALVLGIAGDDDATEDDGWR